MYAGGLDAAGDNIATRSRYLMMGSVSEKMRWLAYERVRVQILRSRQRLQMMSRRTDRRSTCRFNARSAFLLCAVNPEGPCHSCPHYESAP